VGRGGGNLHGPKKAGPYNPEKKQGGREKVQCARPFGNLTRFPVKGGGATLKKGRLSKLGGKAQSKLDQEKGTFFPKQPIPLYRKGSDGRESLDEFLKGKKAKNNIRGLRNGES